MDQSHILLFGSIGVAVDCLEWLLDQREYAVIGVVCSLGPISPWRQATGDRNMAEEAPRLGIPIYSLDDAPPADLGLSVRFGEILRRRHLDRYRHGVVNLHGAPLPEMRGSTCDAMAIIEGRREYGASLHLMDEDMDSGPILKFARFPISQFDRGFDLFRKANETGLELIKAHLSGILTGAVAPVPQAAGRTYLKSSFRKALASPFVPLERKLRATSMPGIRTAKVA